MYAQTRNRGRWSKVHILVTRDVTFCGRDLGSVTGDVRRYLLRRPGESPCRVCVQVRDGKWRPGAKDGEK